jgi:hypothetical protein
VRVEKGGGGREGENKWGFPLGNAHTLRIRRCRTIAVIGKAVAAGTDAHRRRPAVCWAWVGPGTGSGGKSVHGPLTGGPDPV